MGDSDPPVVMFVLPGMGAGGSERVVNELSREWAARGWSIVVVTFACADTPSYYGYARSIALVRLGIPIGAKERWAGLWAALRRVAALRREIRGRRPDAIISFLTRTNVMVLFAGAGLRVPVVVSERNNPALQPIGGVWRCLRALTYPFAFGLVTITKGALDHFPRWMRRRAWVVPNVAWLPPPAVPRAEGRRLTAVGRLVPQKGFDLLIDAFAAVCNAHPEWSLVIWGEGGERPALEARIAHHGLTHRIMMPGVSPTPGGWIADADIFVLSSRYEGWGIVLLEAMGAGLPVISFDCPWGPGEMIEHGRDGLLVPVGDAAALGRALERLMADRDLRCSLGDAARISSARFAPQHVLGRWDSVLAAALPGVLLRERGPGNAGPSLAMQPR